MENIRKTLESHGRRRGVGGAVAAGLVCHEAEKRYPDLFRAVSLKSGILHLEIFKKNLLQFKLIEGSLLRELQDFSTKRELPVPSRYRLTEPRDSDNL